MDPFITLSVITPSYNHEAYLPRCLASVDALAADRDDIEHIVIDDASTDGSWATLERLTEGRPHRTIIRHEANQGLSATLNDALRRARGAWVGWLNSDDSYHAAGLATVLEALPGLPANVGLLYGDVRLLEESGDEAGTLRLYRGAAYCLRLGYNPFLVPSVLLRRSHLVHGFDESYQLLVDMDVYHSVLRSARPRYFPYVIGEWRMHPAQQSANQRPTDAQEWRYLARKHGLWFSSGPTRIGRTWQRLLKLLQLRYHSRCT